MYTRTVGVYRQAIIDNKPRDYHRARVVRRSVLFVVGFVPRRHRLPSAFFFFSLRYNGDTIRRCSSTRTSLITLNDIMVREILLYISY